MNPKNTVSIQAVVNTENTLQPKKLIFFAVFVLIALLAALNSGAAEAQFKAEARSLVVDGITRQYTIYRPGTAASTQKLPLVIALHGAYQTGAGLEATAKLTKAAGAQQFMFVFPEGYGRSWNAGECCGPAQARQINDVKFLRTIVSTLIAEGKAIKTRVYVTGFSNGAKMTYRFACEAAEIVTAIAPVSSALSMETSACNPARAVPVLHSHGLADTVDPFDGGPSSVEGVMQHAVPETINFWSGNNACRQAAPVNTLNGAQCITHQRCTGNAEVTLCTIKKMGHQWPGASAQSAQGETSGQDAPEVLGSNAILQFFGKYK